MDITIKKSDFKNDIATYTFDNQVVYFTNVQENFKNDGREVNIDRINIKSVRFDKSGNKIDTSYGSSIIGIGDQKIGIFSENQLLLGETLTFDNIEDCIIRIYE